MVFLRIDVLKLIWRLEDSKTFLPGRVFYANKGVWAGV